jgi:hypothetical protein
MKSKSKNISRRSKSKPLTLGELIASTYEACGKLRAPKVLQLALASHLIRAPRLAHIHG